MRIQTFSLKDFPFSKMLASPLYKQICYYFDDCIAASVSRLRLRDFALLMMHVENFKTWHFCQENDWIREKEPEYAVGLFNI